MGIAWRCQDYKLAEAALKKRLQKIAFQRGLPFSISKKLWHLKTKAAEEQADGDDSWKSRMPYETSLIHNAFSVARMSLKDREFVRSIVESLGENAHVLYGDRILVLYEADLLSTESIQLLQKLLELHSESGNITIWLTVREAVPAKLADWFLDIPVPMTVPPLHPWAPVLWDWIQKVRAVEKKDIKHVEVLRNALYNLLQRNIRWFDLHQILLDLFIAHEDDFGSEVTAQLIDCLAQSPTTASGVTLVSYRIPIAWEALFVRLYDILAGSHKN
jgi:hypothetical protein